MKAEEIFFIENLDGYSMAEGDKKAGYFSKEKRDARKEKRATRRKARAGAQPLKSFIVGGVQKFKHILHPVKKNADGTGTKPDGTIVPASRMGVIAAPKGLNFPPLNFDKADASNKAVEMITESGVPQAAVTIPINETIKAIGANGVEGTYKTDDTSLELTGAADTKQGMSTQAKVLVGVGAGLLVVGIIYLVKRSKK